MSETERNHTEQLILEAAEQEFFSKGFSGARTTVIAEKAGVTHAMLHYYFRTKEQLFKQIISKNLDLMMQTITVSMGDGDKSFVERIKSGVAAHFDFLKAHAQLPRFFFNEIYVHLTCQPLFEQFHPFFERMKTTLLPLIDQLQHEADQAAARQEIEPVNVRQLYISIMALNIFTFISSSMWDTLSLLMGDTITGCESYLSARKAENIETIVRRIQKR